MTRTQWPKRASKLINTRLESRKKRTKPPEQEKKRKNRVSFAFHRDLRNFQVLKSSHRNRRTFKNLSILLKILPFLPTFVAKIKSSALQSDEQLRIKEQIESKQSGRKVAQTTLSGYLKCSFFQFYCLCFLFIYYFFSFP